MRLFKLFLTGVTAAILAFGPVAAPAIAVPYPAPPYSAPPEAVSKEAGTPTARPKNPVLILPGFLMPEFTYEPLRQSLMRAGYHDVTVLQGWPWCRSIPEYAGLAQQEVDRALARTGAAQVELVCHSMGGLVGRYLIDSLGQAPRVAHYVSFGTPHHGTMIGPLASWYAKSAEEMTPGSPFLTALNQHEGRPGPVKLTALQAALDEIVWPKESSVLAGAANAEVPWAPHIGGIFFPELARLTIEALEQ